jgi:hypothetical protein
MIINDNKAELIFSNVHGTEKAFFSSGLTALIDLCVKLLVTTDEEGIDFMHGHDLDVKCNIAHRTVVIPGNIVIRTEHTKSTGRHTLNRLNSNSNSNSNRIF